MAKVKDAIADARAGFAKAAAAKLLENGVKDNNNAAKDTIKVIEQLGKEKEATKTTEVKEQVSMPVTVESAKVAQANARAAIAEANFKELKADVKEKEAFAAEERAKEVSDAAELKAREVGIAEEKA